MMNDEKKRLIRCGRRRRRGVAPLAVGALVILSHPGTVSGFCPLFHRGARSSSSTLLLSSQGEQLRRPSSPFRQLSATLPYWPVNRPDATNKPKDWLTETISNKMPDMSSSTYNAAVGLFLFIGVIYVLSSNNEPGAMSTSGEGFEILESSVSSAGRNVLKAALPQTASDVVSVALGEGIAGVIGAIATLAVSLLLRVRAANQELVGGIVQKQDLVREAIADGDYFVTRAAALPLFEALGLSPLAASVTSVILASVPYEFIKLGGSREYAHKSEDELMDELLKEEQKKKRQERGIFSMMSMGEDKKKESTVDVNSLVPVTDGKPIDFVELFSDITKWLEYDVLKSDLTGRVVWNGQVLASNVDSALFGFLAALSSQLYASIAYIYTDYGTEEKKKESRERSLEGWIKLYATTSLNSAVLFGVYESVKSPVSTAISGFLSGGVENCVGSEYYKTCVDAYILNNPPAADFAAQFRSLITALVSLWDRIQNDGSLDKAEFTRSLIVQLYSLAEQIFSFGLFSADVGVEPGQYLSI